MTHRPGFLPAPKALGILPPVGLAAATACPLGGPHGPLPTRRQGGAQWESVDLFTGHWASNPCPRGLRTAQGAYSAAPFLGASSTRGWRWHQRCIAMRCWVRH